MLRAVLALTVFAILTLLLIPMLALLRALRLPGRGALSMGYSRVICAVLGVKISVQGTKPANIPVLLVANHVSWLDIFVITAVAPVMFVAKREVAGWPLIGWAAKVRGTVFVDRQRRHATDGTNAEIAAALAGGAAIVLFAEGTSSDGNRVLPFRSALLGALRGPGEVAVQPLAIAYTRIHGLPMGRRHRPLAAWYGDMDLAPHVVGLARRGPVDVTLSFGDAHVLGGNRKALARRMEEAVRAMTNDVLRQRDTA